MSAIVGEDVTGESADDYLRSIDWVSSVPDHRDSIDPPIDYLSNAKTHMWPAEGTLVVWLATSMTARCGLLKDYIHYGSVFTGLTKR